MLQIFSGTRYLRLLPPLVLLGLCILIIVARLHTYDEPLERDITTYAVIAHEMAQGRDLYSDLWDHKPPAVHATYLMAEMLVGYGETAICLLGVSAAIITLFGVYIAGRIYDGRKSTGLWAASFWALTASDMQLQANQPNVEVFLNACLIWAFVALLKLLFEQRWYHMTLAAGMMLALASLYKPVVVFVAIAFGAALFGIRSLAQQRGYITALVQVGVLAATGLASWFAVGTYFHLRGNFEDFYNAVITYNRFYSGDMLDNFATGLHVSRLMPEFLYFALPLVAMLIVGLGFGWRGRRAFWLLLLAYMVGVQLATAAPGFFYPHYYQLWLPVLTVGAAWGISALNDIVMERYRFSGSLAAALIVILLAYHAGGQYRLTPDQWSQAKYGNVFVSTKKVADKIAGVLEDGESFYEWGAETGLYFYSGISPPTGVFYHYPLLSRWPQVGKLSDKVIRQLEHQRPALIILNRAILPRPENTQQIIVGGHPVLNWIGKNYRLLPGVDQQGALLFLAKADSRLYRSYVAKRR